jgi:pimeloyl-ACP methyl ester carboxylesterase
MSRREQLSLGKRQISYLFSETPSPGARQQPLRTVLFLHAFPLNADMWHPQVGVAPAGWRMVAPDYRGFGQSSLSDSPKTTMNDLAGDAIDLLDRLEITEAVVAGCSMGGYVAFELLESAPRYVKGLVLIDTRAGADTEDGKAARLKMLETIDTGGSEAIADDMTPKLLGATTRRERPDLVKHIHQMIRAANPAAIKMAVTAIMNRKDMTPFINGIKVPTLIIAGAEDALIPAVAIQEMHGAIKHSGLVTIPFAGHLPNLEQTVPFDVELQQFLQRF